jgi:hypothetical protein
LRCGTRRVEACLRFCGHSPIAAATIASKRLREAPSHACNDIPERFVASTDRAFTVVTKQGRIARWVRTRLVPVIAPPLFRVPSIRRLLFLTVSQIGVNYRNSPLCSGAAGAVRGGDRLPWVETETGGDNFAPLASLTWQVHVYGEPQGGLADACADMSLPLHHFAWRPEMRRAGLLRAALYLVRPDGYVGFADPYADPGRLRHYFDARGSVGQQSGRVCHAG